MVAATDTVPGGSSPVVLWPDPRHRLPGRGAWVHPALDCLESAVRRKAFGRALRLRAAVDVGAVERHLAGGDTASRSRTVGHGHANSQRSTNEPTRRVETL
ncbi:MAG: YlxR family protein [Humibacillus sp.]